MLVMVMVGAGRARLKDQFLPGVRVVRGVLGGGRGGGGGGRRESGGSRGVTRGRDELLVVFDDGRGLVDDLLSCHQRLPETDRQTDRQGGRDVHNTLSLIQWNLSYLNSTGAGKCPH